MVAFKDYLTGEVVTVSAVKKKHARKRFLAVRLGITQAAAGKLGCKPVASAAMDGENGVYYGLTEESHNTLKCCTGCGADMQVAGKEWTKDWSLARTKAQQTDPASKGVICASCPTGGVVPPAPNTAPPARVSANNTLVPGSTALEKASAEPTIGVPLSPAGAPNTAPPGADGNTMLLGPLGPLSAIPPHSRGAAAAFHSTEMMPLPGSGSPAGKGVICARCPTGGNPTAIAVPGGGEPAQGARNPPPEAGSERVSGADENTMPPKASPLPSLAAAAAFRRAHTTPSLGSGSPAVSPVDGSPLFLFSFCQNEIYPPHPPHPPHRRAERRRCPSIGQFGTSDQPCCCWVEKGAR